MIISDFVSFLDDSRTIGIICPLTSKIKSPSDSSIGISNVIGLFVVRVLGFFSVESYL